MKRQPQVALILLILLVSSAVFMQATQAQQTDSSLKEKAAAFLTDIVQLNLSNYTVTVNQTSPNYLRLYIDPTNLADPNWQYHIKTDFNFYDGDVRSCELLPGSAGLPYANPSSDLFNATLGFLERYQNWKGDAQVQEMTALLKSVGSEKNTTLTINNLTLTIQQTNRITSYSFLNTFNGAQYTGITIQYNHRTGSFDFDDNRQFLKIGDTSINISEEQAINIAIDYLKTYSFNYRLYNGTTVRVSDFNITSVYQTTLETGVKGEYTLCPVWNIQFNASDMPTYMPTHDLGIGVRVWSGDGAVSGAYTFDLPLPFSADEVLQILLGAYLFFVGSIVFVVIVVVLLVVLVALLRRTKKAPSGTPQVKGNF